MSKDRLQENWQEIKTDLQRSWGKVPSSDWDQTKGEMTAVSGLIEKRYGLSRDEITPKLKSIFDKYIDGKEPPTSQNRNLKDQRMQDNVDSGYGDYI